MFPTFRVPAVFPYVPVDTKTGNIWEHTGTLTLNVPVFPPL